MTNAHKAMITGVLLINAWTAGALTWGLDAVLVVEVDALAWWILGSIVIVPLATTTKKFTTRHPLNTRRSVLFLRGRSRRLTLSDVVAANMQLSNDAPVVDLLALTLAER